MPLSSGFGLLRDRDFRGLFASTTVSQFGFQITQLALPLVAVVELDAGELAVGVLYAMVTAAFLFVGLPAGAWVDRMRRRNVLIACDLLRAALLATIPLAWWADVLTMWQLYAVALVNGVFTVFFDVAYQSYLPHLVGRHNLVEGNAKLESVRSTAQLGGPALGGQLIKLLTAPVALLVDAIAMAASALFVVGIRKREPKPEPPQRHLLAEIGEGLSFVVRNRLLRRIAMCTGWSNLWAAAFTSMELVFLSRELGQDEGTIGLIVSVGGVGGLAGALVARRFARVVGQGPAIWVPITVGSLGFLLMPAAEPGWRLWLAAAGMALYGLGAVMYNVTQVSFRQGMTPDHLLGRMNATMRFLVWGTLPLGGLLGGVLGQLLGVRPTLWIAAIGCCLAFLPVFLSPLRTMRRLPSIHDPAEPEPVPASLSFTQPPICLIRLRDHIESSRLHGWTSSTWTSMTTPR